MKSAYAGSGNPAPSLFDSTVRVTIRQSDSEAITSEAATASLSPVDATATAGQLNPAAPEDRFMGPFLKILKRAKSFTIAGESPALRGL
jgi:hypothetical protein